MYIPVHILSARYPCGRSVAEFKVMVWAPAPAAPQLHIHVADRFLMRARGLLWRTPLPLGHYMYIPNCRSVHTFGMRYALTIIFVDGQGHAVRIDRKVVPNRIVICWEASAVCETTWTPAEDAAVVDLTLLQSSLAQVQVRSKTPR
jgi:uncharacterized membrane protein (UPF0127 family)